MCLLPLYSDIFIYLVSRLETAVGSRQPKKHNMKGNAWGEACLSSCYKRGRESLKFYGLLKERPARGSKNVGIVQPSQNTFKLPYQIGFRMGKKYELVLVLNWNIDRLRVDVILYKVGNVFLKAFPTQVVYWLLFE